MFFSSSLKQMKETEFPLEPFKIIMKCCEEPYKSNTTSQAHKLPGEGEDRWEGQRGAVLFSQPDSGQCVDAAVFVCC